MVGRFNFLLGWPFLKGYVSFRGGYFIHSRPRADAIGFTTSEDETASGSSSGKHHTAVLDRTTDSRQLANFQKRTEFGVSLVHLFKGNVGNKVFIFKVSLSFSVFLKELFNLTISALKLLCCSYPRTKKHTHTQIFSGKTRNSHVQLTRPRYHQHHPPSHPVVMKLKWGRPRGWRDGVVLVLIGRQGIKIRNRDDLEGARSSLRPQKTLKTPKKHEKITLLRVIPTMTCWVEVVR